MWLVKNWNSDNIFQILSYVSKPRQQVIELYLRCHKVYILYLISTNYKRDVQQVGYSAMETDLSGSDKLCNL